LLFLSSPMNRFRGRRGWDGIARLQPPALARRYLPRRATALVTGVVAFYNPSNTALEAVVLFIRHPGTQPPLRTVAFSARECESINLHFGNSQEH
jgi:hypothetical protein